ncbi:MAG: hypothetical protein MI741_02860 [Rhodospirillales bacterium]|nr:hypothetical protein [Rhodospirillales bacterium]
MGQMTPIYTIRQFGAALTIRAQSLCHSNQGRPFVFPVGIFLVLDAENGGDDLSKEVISRRGLIDYESANFIDFYLPGWSEQHPQGHAKGLKAKVGGLQFDLDMFHQFREFFRDLGIAAFGGYADLILFDVHVDAIDVDPSVADNFLDFRNGIHIDLSRAVKEQKIPSVGGFIQSIIEAARDLKNDPSVSKVGAVHAISDEIGVAIAERSLLEFLLTRFGKIIGGPALFSIATRRLADNMTHSDFMQRCNDNNSVVWF